MQGPLSPSAPRRVAFSREVKVRPYYRSPRTTAMKEQLWYSQEELRRQRINDMRDIEMVRQAAASCESFPEMGLIKVVESLSEYGPWCIRGLEPLLDGGQEKAKNKLRGVLAVLTEQRRQGKERESDARQIAMRYKQATQQCQEEAHRRAIQDSGAIPMSAAELSKEETAAIGQFSRTNLSHFPLAAPQTLLSRAA